VTPINKIMDCPICGWRMIERKQWSAGGYALGLFYCNECECEVSIKAPIANVPSWPTLEEE
tara:strand:- start:1898 stop:2080 length:183 start_codon:yes stop_codon:yes gene_type:complete